MNRQAQPANSIDWEALPLVVGDVKASEICGFSLSYFRKARSEGSPGGRTEGPPYIKLGKRVLYKVADLRAWVDGLETQRVV